MMLGKCLTTNLPTFPIDHYHYPILINIKTILLYIHKYTYIINNILKLVFIELLRDGKISFISIYENRFMLGFKYANMVELLLSKLGCNFGFKCLNINIYII